MNKCRGFEGLEGICFYTTTRGKVFWVVLGQGCMRSSLSRHETVQMLILRSHHLGGRRPRELPWKREITEEANKPR